MATKNSHQHETPSSITAIFLKWQKTMKQNQSKKQSTFPTIFQQITSISRFTLLLLLSEQQQHQKQQRKRQTKTNSRIEKRNALHKTRYCHVTPRSLTLSFQFPTNMFNF